MSEYDDEPQTYPVGTHTCNIVRFDRGIKVIFECKDHPGPWYASKQPSVSAWFPANQQAIDIQNGMATDPCPHTAKDYTRWITTTEYIGLA